ncbi:TonB-linked outer membrane protein, SusC/RagA family [Parapedobacter indicus]|uniref:TonB-linked outer membrane protein, SusC/RagA family n=2 Tax=Parapedobacter indicus TaxID=1477437 RepID=A0A1I3TX12_9SPHI|nr:TonB-linked SusC/RagA family outer membrane protein [Parapedobacter indicus]SFJ74849.1 TonB-linked outer membrane protein, SusC/RagA family [Parapedobacter indicus]
MSRCGLKIPTVLNQLLLVMRITTLFVLLGFLHVSAASLSQTITLHVKRQPIEDVFSAIEKQTGYWVMYNDRLVHAAEPITIEATDMPLKDFLNKVLTPLALTYTVAHTNILIKAKDNRAFGHRTPGSETAVAEMQQQTLRGTITDGDGQPLAGVTVRIPGTTAATTSDENGVYVLTVPSGGQQISFRMVGFESREYAVAGLTTLDVVLQATVSDLDEVVVVGYGAVKKKDLTGSVASVQTQDFKDIPANSIENLLQGRASGLQIVKTSQDPGAGTTVRIRGGSSLRGSNAPLLVVDGFPLGDAGNLKQINPADIVSIEVMKDASASSIYGSRGANGVIMVTTRKAAAGKTEINAKHQTTLSQFASDIIQWTDPALMAQLDNEAKINGGMPPLYVGAVNSTGIYYPSVREIQDGTWPHFTDWADVVFRDNALTHTTTVSLANANDKTSFNLSANNFAQDGVYIKDAYNKQILNLNIKHEISKRLTVSAFNNLSRDTRTANSGLPYWRNPLWPVYDEAGGYFLAGAADYEHPLAWTDHRKSINKGTDFISSWLLDLDVVDGLNLRSQFNYKYGASITDRYEPDVYTETGTNNKGAAFLDNWMGQVYTADTYLTYDKAFGKDHALTAMLGHSYEYSLARSSALESYNFKNGALNNENMASGAPELNRHTNGQTLTKLLSFFGRMNYAYKDRYLLTLTLRADGSSKFSANHKWAYFPSGALSWKLHEEDFIKDLGIFDELKLRASYGISGNQGISPYQTLSRYGIETFFTDGAWNTAIGPGYVIGFTGVGGRYKEWGGIPNRDLKWETTAQYNLGLDVSFLRNRLRLTADYYDKHTFDLLRERYLALSSGYDRMWVNDGEIANRGVELTVDADIVRTRDWDFSGTFIFSRNVNKVVSLGDAITSGLNTDYLSGVQYEYYGNGVDPFREPSPNILAVGMPVNVFYGYRVNGILQSAAEGAAAGLQGAEAGAGEYRYMDLSQDGVFDTRDRTVIRDPNPDFLASLNLRSRYKNFDVSVFLNGVFGNDVLWSGMYNSAMYVPLRWTPDNPTQQYPSARQGRLYYTSDWFVKDGSFLRVQNVNLGYTLRFPHASWIQQARLSVNAENLFTFSSFEGYDPEVPLNGRYGGGYPKLRTFTFGIDFTL